MKQTVEEIRHVRCSEHRNEEERVMGAVLEGGWGCGRLCVER